MKRFFGVVNAVIVASMVLVGANLASASSIKKSINNISFNQAGKSETIDGYIRSADNDNGSFTNKYKFTLWGDGKFSFKLIETWDANNFFSPRKIDISSVQLTNGNKVIDATAASGNFVFDSGQYSSPSQVANWSWTNLAKGDYTLTLRGKTLNNPWSNADYQMRDITFTRGDGPVSPSEVPEPATMALLGFGLLGISGVARKNRKN